MEFLRELPGLYFRCVQKCSVLCYKQPNGSLHCTKKVGGYNSTHVACLYLQSPLEGTFMIVFDRILQRYRKRYPLGRIYLKLLLSIK